MAGKVPELRTREYFEGNDINLKTQESVEKSIDELKASIFDDINYFESGESDGGKEITRDEQFQLSLWSMTVNKFLGKIPPEVRRACVEKLNQLKETFATLCQKGRITSNGDYLKYDKGQATYTDKTFNEQPRQTKTSQTTPPDPSSDAYVEPDEDENNPVEKISGDSHDTQVVIEGWIQKHFGDVPNVHALDGQDGDAKVVGYNPLQNIQPTKTRVEAQKLAKVFTPELGQQYKDGLIQ